MESPLRCPREALRAPGSFLLPSATAKGSAPSASAPSRFACCAHRPPKKLTKAADGSAPVGRGAYSALQKARAPPAAAVPGPSPSPHRRSRPPTPEAAGGGTRAPPRRVVVFVVGQSVAARRAGRPPLQPRIDALPVEEVPARQGTDLFPPLILDEADRAALLLLLLLLLLVEGPNDITPVFARARSRALSRVGSAVPIVVEVDDKVPPPAVGVPRLANDPLPPPPPRTISPAWRRSSPW